MDSIGDGLGMGIDEGIKDTVAAFQVNGISTTASCEGHATRHRTSPWIDIGIIAPAEWGHIKKWWKDKKKVDFLIKKNLREAKKMIPLLDLFYRNRISSWDSRLILDRAAWDFRLQSAGTGMLNLLPSAQRSKKLKAYRKELVAFGLFLKKRFLEKK